MKEQRKDRDEAIRVPEPLQKEEVEYPYGFFDAQVRFAVKWTQITGEPLDQTLLHKTGLYRRITNEKYPKAEEVWQAALAKISPTQTIDEITQTLYDEYLKQPHHIYTSPTYPENDGKHFGFFAFDYYPENPATGEKNRIKVHFINKARGDKSSLDKDYLAEIQADLKRMFAYIREKYPQVEDVIGGSWLYALQSYRDSFPPQFTAQMKRLVPPELAHMPDTVPNMAFQGNSLWGQFMDRRGGVRQHVYDQFVQNIESAQTLEELINAFPNVPYQPKVPVSVFYDWIDN